MVPAPQLIEDETAGSSQPLVEPADAQVAASQLTAFIYECRRRAHRDFADYADFERYCIDHSAQFWTLLLEWSRLICEGQAAPAITSADCESAQFFPGLRLNYVENLLRLDACDFAPQRPALTCVHADRPTQRWSRGQLRERVSALAAALTELGLRPGDRVSIVAQNGAGAVMGCLAAAAIGCTVSTGAPDMGSDALLSRFAQTRPLLLMADLPDPATALGRQQRERLVEIVRGLPTLRHVVLLDEWDAPAGLAPVEVHRADELLARHAGALAAWPRLPFNHPLYILFTSGTTGLPKCLVHGAGGTLLEHLKEHRLHCDLRAWGDKLFFQTSTGWMMWNWQLSALASGVEVVLYDGPLTAPERLWRIVADEGVTVFGTSPAYLQMCERSGWTPGPDFDFAPLRAVLSTGSILYPRQQDWLWDQVKRVAVQSISGGTDIVGCFVLGNPNLPVYSAQCQCRSLGLDVRALDEKGQARAGQVGELVCANPFPSRPLGLLDDAEGTRFHAAYFAAYPGVWTHGDLIEFTPHGSARMHGRSDGVLNIRGIRIGPAEIYRILADVPEISEAMAVEQHAEDEPGAARLVLLLVLRQGYVLGDELAGRIKRELGRRGSAVHVPAALLAVEQLPTTHSGKRSERSARDALNGRPVINRAALSNPECLEPLQRYALSPRRAELPAAERDNQSGASLQEVITRIWEETLRVKPVGAHDNYFDLGGDSLRALQIGAELKRRTGRSIPLTLLFEAPTVASLTARLLEETAPAYRPLVLLKEGPGPSLFIVHGVGGNAMELRALSQQISAHRSVYAIQARGFDADDAPHERIEDMAREYLAAVRAVQPAGPYLLAGYSFGGLVAYEMARMLQQAGEQIALLGLLDTIVAERFWPLTAWTEYFVRRVRCNLRDMRQRKLRELPPLALRLLRSLSQRVQRRKLSMQIIPEVLATEQELPSEIQRVRRAGFTAAMAYRPPPSEIEISLFRSDVDISHLCDPQAVWRKLTPRVTVYNVPGTHATMIRPPYNRGLAEQLSRCLTPSH